MRKTAVEIFSDNDAALNSGSHVALRISPPTLENKFINTDIVIKSMYYN